MDNIELKNRTKQFALRVIKLSEALPKNITGRNVSNQIMRSGTSVAANYRATLRARSDKEFISKLNIVLEECDETCFWLEIIIESNLIKKEKVEDLYNEADELTAIFVSTLKTMNKKKSKV
jgi:four helix bundle protein